MTTYSRKPCNFYFTSSIYWKTSHWLKNIKNLQFLIHITKFIDELWGNGYMDSMASPSFYQSWTDNDKRKYENWNCFQAWHVIFTFKIQDPMQALLQDILTYFPRKIDSGVADISQKSDTCQWSIFLKLSFRETGNWCAKGRTTEIFILNRNRIGTTKVLSLPAFIRFFIVLLNCRNKKWYKKMKK